MTSANVAVEVAIERALLDQWDPLGVREQPGTHNEYARHAHEVFGMLLRGASDVQIARLLHRAEADEFQHPELAERDLTPLVRELRKIEASLGPKVL